MRNDNMIPYGNYTDPYGQGEPPRGRGRFGWGTVLVTGLVCFFVGALLTLLIGTGLAAGRELQGFVAQSAQPTPAATALPEDAEAPGAAEATPPVLSTPAPTPYTTPTRPERAVPVLGSRVPLNIDPTQPVIDISDKVTASVVNLYTSVDVYSDTTHRYLEQAYANGSGVILTADGYIVTNAHLLEDCDHVYVEAEEQTYPAEVIGKDASVDIAVLKIDAKGLKPATLGSSADVRVGEVAITIANQNGRLSGTVTTGIISAVNRQMIYDGKSRVFLQTDAAINPGSSGGALLNDRGEVVGIITQKTVFSGFDDYGNTISAEGLGYALPIDDVLPVVRQLIQYGFVARPAIGIRAYEMTEDDALEWETPKGILITSITLGSPAEEAGLLVEDIIVKVDGATFSSFEELTDIIKAKGVGGTVVLTAWREGNEHDCTVTIGDMNEIEAKGEALTQEKMYGTD